MNASSNTMATDDQSGSNDLADRVEGGLRQLISHAVPSAEQIAVTRLSRAAGGLSRENWTVDVSWVGSTGRQQYRLMLMRDAAGTLLNTERSREYDVLKALEKSQVVAPQVFWMDPQGSFLGAPSLVMERMPGECDYMVLNGERPLKNRLQLARDFLRLLVDIQSVNWRVTGLDVSLGLPEKSPSAIQLDHWVAEYDSVRLEPHPELDYVLQWLARRAPDAETIVLVHGDFKPGNALVEGNRITAMLDWETAHLGDPLEDLGWITNPVRGREHQIEGHWEREQIVATYRELTGRSVSDADLTWWNVFSCWKLAIIQLTAISEFVAGRYDRVFQTPTWLYRPMFRMMESVQ